MSSRSLLPLESSLLIEKSGQSACVIIHYPLFIKMRKISWQKRLFYYLIRTPVSLFFMIFYGVRFYGKENLPGEGGVLVVANHQSHFDPPLIGAGLRRRLNYMARKTLFKFKPFAMLIDLCDAIPLDVQGIGYEGVKESLKRLRGGEAVLIFPEGARTWDGDMIPFKKGALSLAQRGKAAILPVAIDGCYDVWPRTRKFPRLWGRIRVEYGKPISFEEIEHLEEEELRHLVENRVRELTESLKKRKKYRKDFAGK